MSHPGALELREWLGEIDIYWFDQLLKGRVTRGMRVLDAGCGRGRNLVYLMRAGVEVYGVDTDGDAIADLRRLAAEIAPALPAGNFRVEPVEAMSFDDAAFDVVLLSAVLHFATDEAQFQRMLDGAWRVLRPQGLFFSRLASSIGLEDRIVRLEGRRARLPDGTDRYLVDEVFLTETTRRLGGEWIEPLKTVKVQHERCMTTWCLRKR